MGYYKRNWLQEFGIGEFFLYRNFLDAIFCMFKNEIDTEHFFKYLNYKHPNIKFSMENETIKFLTFSDVLMKNEGRTFYYFNV